MRFLYAGYFSTYVDDSVYNLSVHRVCPHIIYVHGDECDLSLATIAANICCFSGVRFISDSVFALCRRDAREFFHFVLPLSSSISIVRHL